MSKVQEFKIHCFSIKVQSPESLLRMLSLAITLHHADAHDEQDGAMGMTIAIASDSLFGCRCRQFSKVPKNTSSKY